jgi:hypothetical protein
MEREFESHQLEEKEMLFRKDMEPRCTYCLHGEPISEEQVACAKKGIRNAGNSCRKFSYDPLKRIPPRPAALNADKFKDEDFSL